jgi:hypothetical protein
MRNYENESLNTIAMVCCISSFLQVVLNIENAVAGTCSPNCLLYGQTYFYATCPVKSNWFEWKG